MRFSSRPPLGAVLAVSIVVPTAIVLPTLSSAPSAPRPITPQVQNLVLKGVDAASLEAASLDSEALPIPLRQADRREPVVLTAELATDDYRMLAVTWSAASASEALVSARTHTNGAWTNWIEIHAMHDLDSGSAPNGRLGTEPYWAGDSDGVQVRVDAVGQREPRALQIDLIEPGTSPADAAITDPPPAGSAYADDDRPNIVTRAEWGANESLRDKHLDMSKTIKASFVHHTAGSNNYGPNQGPAVVRGLYSYYVNSLGYADIGYNFLVDRYGNVYEGRHGSITKPVRQAATGGFNRDTMSVVAMGNFETASASDALVKGIARILAFRLSSYHLDPNDTIKLRAEEGSSRYSRGERAKFKVVSGHRDAGFTACPGQNLFRRMDDIRRNTRNYMGANLVTPRASPKTFKAGEDVDISVRAGVLRKQDWTLTITELCTGKVVRRITGTAGPKNPIRQSWSGRNDAGNLVAPGRYRLALSSTAGASRSWPWSKKVVVGVGGARGAGPTSSLPAISSGTYVPITPQGVMNTRTGQGLARPLVLGSGSRVSTRILGRGGVPLSNVSAVAISVVASCAEKPTSISVSPRGSRAGTTVVSVDRRGTARGLTVVRLGTQGELVFRNRKGLVGLDVSVVGYVSSGGGGGSLTPLARSTLAGAGPITVTPTPKDVAIAGRAGVPADARAVVLNVRRSGASKVTNLWAWRSGGAQPEPSSWRRGPGGPASGRVIVPLGADGEIRLAANRSGPVSLDVVGYVSQSSDRLVRPVVPSQLTKAGRRLRAGEKATVSVHGRAGVPTSARVALLQVSGIDAGRDAKLTVYPRGKSRPSPADVLIPKNKTRDGLVLVPIGDRGDVRVAASDGSVGLRVVVVGWVS